MIQRNKIAPISSHTTKNVYTSIKKRKHIFKSNTFMLFYGYIVGDINAPQRRSSYSF